MEITQQVLQDFEKKTNVPIINFLLNSASFFSYNYSRLVSYYSGEVKEIDKNVFAQLKVLQLQSNEVLSAFHNIKGLFNNVIWWGVLELVENIDSQIATTYNLNRWCRSSLTSFGYNPAVQIGYTMKAHQTLERVAQDVLQKDDSQDAWYNIAIANDLKEEDYTIAGGNTITLSFPRINEGLNLSSVVDVMTGKNVYGKDIDATLHFEDDDLAVLSPDDTIMQTVNILALLKKNDNPDFPNDGIQQAVAIGSNRNALNFAVIQRQYNETFGTDDSLRAFNINTIQVTEDALQIEFTVQTRLGDTREQLILV